MNLLNFPYNLQEMLHEGESQSPDMEPNRRVNEKLPNNGANEKAKKPAQYTGAQKDVNKNENDKN